MEIHFNFEYVPVLLVKNTMYIHLGKFNLAFLNEIAVFFKEKLVNAKQNNHIPCVI